MNGDTSNLNRVKVALRDETADRPPCGFWMRLPGVVLDTARLADETPASCIRYELDFVKSMPNGLCYLKHRGWERESEEVERGGAGKMTPPAIRSAGERARLEPFALVARPFSRESEHLDRLVARLGPDVPVLSTVFSPLTTASKPSARRRAQPADGSTCFTCIART